MVTLYYLFATDYDRSFEFEINGEEFELDDLTIEQKEDLLKHIYNKLSKKLNLSIRYGKELGLSGLEDNFLITTSCVSFKYNSRYYAFVLSDKKVYVFVTGRELTLVETKKSAIIKRIKRPMREVFLKCIFGGWNAYKYENDIRNIHIFKIDPISLIYNQFIYHYMRLFFKTNMESEKFFKFSFFLHELKLKKIRSVKKNLLKKQLKKNKNSDYTILTS